MKFALFLAFMLLFNIWEEQPVASVILTDIGMICVTILLASHILHS